LKTHIVAQGETLWQIAQKYHITLEELLDANPDIEDPNVISPGLSLIIPEETSVCPRRQCPAAPSGNQADTVEDWETLLPRPCIYIIKSGDTLYDLAKAFNLTLTQLLHANPQIENPDEIMAGDKLFIPRGCRMNSNLPLICPYCGRTFYPR